MHIVCVCCGTGFPNGLAQTSRIKMVGRSVLEGGGRFTVFHLGGSEFPNESPKGDYCGIAYRYFPGSLIRTRSFLQRKVTYFFGMIESIFELNRIRRENKLVCVYLWIGGNLNGIIYRIFLKMMGIRCVNEINEWWPGRTARVRRALMIKQSNGSILISRPLLERVESLCPSDKYAYLLLPILVDTHEWARISERRSPCNKAYFLWSGNLFSNRKDISHILQSIHEADLNVSWRLIITGSSDDSLKVSVKQEASEIGLDADRITFAGFLSYEELKSYMWHASALLLPLWANEERSICRFPTKLGEYLASGTPVITCPVGDVASYLSHEKNAFVVPAANVQAYGQAIRSVLYEPNKAQEIGARGKSVSMDFDFRKHTEELISFFEGVCNS